MKIELLEARIAPATFTYTDVDGDRVTIKTSMGSDAGLSAAVKLVDGQLQKIDLSLLLFGVEFAGTNLSVTVKKVLGGDGQAHVGFLKAEGVDLGKVTIQGDLSEIVAGDDDTKTAAIKSLSVASVGRFGAMTRGSDYSDHSLIRGPVGKLSVTGDFEHINLEILGGADPADGRLGSMTIGGSLRGGGGTEQAFIKTSGDIGSVKIKGDISAGTGGASALIAAVGKIGRVTISGSLIGGGAYSGGIEGFAGIGPVKIGGNVVGGVGASSGTITSAGGPIASVTIGGSLIGGQSASTGVIASSGDMGWVRIAGDFIGGSLVNDLPGNGTYLQHAGSIYSHGRIAGVGIGGSIMAGRDFNPNYDLRFNASITALDDIGSIKVGGSISGTHETFVSITARGQETPGGNRDLAIGKITVGGDVACTLIRAGASYSPDGTLALSNGDASFGAVKIGGSWTASSLSAGIDPVNGQFGDADDSIISGSNPELIARIASITIGGEVVGTHLNVAPTDYYGFVAQQIGSFKAGGVIARLTGDTDSPVHLSPITRDVAIRELA